MLEDLKRSIPKLRLFKLTVEVKFNKSSPELFKYREKVIAALSNEKINIPDINEGFGFNVKKRAMKVSVEKKKNSN